MSGSPEAALQRYAIEKGKIIVAAEKIQTLPSDSSERALYWSAFVQATKNAVAALVRGGTLDPLTRGVAHKIKNWENTDRIFKYLLHVRNAEAHAEEHNDDVPNPVLAQALNIGGGLIRIEGQGSVTLTGNTVNGVPIADGLYSLGKDGQISAPYWHGPVMYSPMQLNLKPVKDKHGNTYNFPLEMVAAGDLPEVFAAKHVMVSLAVWESELRSVRRE